MSIEHKPNKALRIGLAATVGFLGAAGAVTVGKTLLDSASKSNVSASSEQPGRLMPTQQAFNELVTVTTTSVPTVRSTEIPATVTSVPPTVEATRVPTKEPTKTPTIVPTIEPTKVPTIEPTKAPTVAPTKEAVQEVPCGILPIEYCSKAEFVVQKLPNGGTMKMIGFRLPAETPVFLPEDGQATKTKLVDHPFFKGYQIKIFDPNDPKKPKYKLSGDIQPDNMFSLNMKKGERFGQMQDTGIDMIGYNLIFYVADIDANGNEVVNEARMREMFPAAFAKPAREDTFTGALGGPAIHTTVYLNTAPTIVPNITPAIK